MHARSVPCSLALCQVILLFGFILLCLNRAFAYLSQISSGLLNKLELSSGEQPKALNQLERVLIFKNLKVSLSLLTLLPSSFSCKHHLRDSYVVCSKSPSTHLTQHGFWRQCMPWLLCSVVAAAGAGLGGRDRPLFYCSIECLGECHLRQHHSILWRKGVRGHGCKIGQ